MKKKNIFLLGTHIGALIPLALLLWDASNNNLTINPIQEMTLRTGKTALVLLVLTLAASPLNLIFGFNKFILVRKWLGLYAFFYALIHFLIFVGLDYGFVWLYIKDALFEKRFALVGFAAFLLMVPLAVTSTKGWQKRLGKRWKSLHRLVYVSGILVVVHYLWLVKSDIREPLVYGVIIGFLLFSRIPPIQKRLRSNKIKTAIRQV